MKQVSGSECSCGRPSDPSSDLCGNNGRIITYGISSSNEWHAESVRPNLQGGSDYILVIVTVLMLMGDQGKLKESIDCFKLHLSKFRGISRCFEMFGTIYGCHIYDHYAHHPTEVRAVLQAARQRFPEKTLLVVFQPHTCSGLVALKDDFATAFSDADKVVITEVDAARERNSWNITGRDLAASIVSPSTEYISSLGDVVDKLTVVISRDPLHETVILTLGAGDVTTVGPKLLQQLQNMLRN
ncbi:UDP-N-acetylmuramate--L-alanine ligase-like isoform X2 [Mangifera indica]|nr:UDP-N-acetylmuramate--L-alanine ligase-like isoform X2 [Mangifera indica]XP_044467615.1 UDP-N-acetylmuramate--L-alanine ligase-like isoform X2 [Mangifera indica]